MESMLDYRTVCRTFEWQVPKYFNFGADVVDALATDPQRLALIWCDENGDEKT